MHYAEIFSAEKKYILAQNIDCGYTSARLFFNPQSVLEQKYEKMYIHLNPSFTK